MGNNRKIRSPKRKMQTRGTKIGTTRTSKKIRKTTTRGTAETRKNRKKKNKLMFIYISLYSLIILNLFISVYLFHNLYIKSLFTTQKAFFNKIFIFFIKNGCAFLFYLRYK